MAQPTSATTVTAAHPAASYDEAIARIQALQAKDGPDVRPDSCTRLWTHGSQAERAIVYYHGYTNAPPQFNQLGDELFKRGYNVLAPRLPYHELLDPLSKAQGKLTAVEMEQMTVETTDIAHGLGKHVTIAGLSGGGVMAAWAAQFRPDVHHAVVMGPAFGLPFVPAWVSTVFRSWAPHLPDLYIWWDPRVKEKIVGPPHAYPRFCTHGLAAIFRLGKTVQDAARQTAPAAQHIQMITSGFDTAIHLPTAHKVAAAWKAHGAGVEMYEFPQEMKIWHDMIDPAQSTQQIDKVYPVVLAMITK